MLRKNVIFLTGDLLLASEGSVLHVLAVDTTGAHIPRLLPLQALLQLDGFPKWSG